MRCYKFGVGSTSVMYLIQNEPNVVVCGRLKDKPTQSHYFTTGQRDHRTDGGGYPHLQVMSSECWILMPAWARVSLQKQHDILIEWKPAGPGVTKCQWGSALLGQAWGWASLWSNWVHGDQKPLVDSWKLDVHNTQSQPHQSHSSKKQIIFREVCLVYLKDLRGLSSEPAVRLWVAVYYLGCRRTWRRQSQGEGLRIGLKSRQRQLLAAADGSRDDGTLAGLSRILIETWNPAGFLGHMTCTVAQGSHLEEPHVD